MNNLKKNIRGYIFLSFDEKEKEVSNLEQVFTLTFSFASAIK